MTTWDVRSEALEQIPQTCALVLRLRDAGLTDEQIAARLAIDVVTVSPLLKVAEAKLAVAMQALDAEARRLT